MAAVPERLLADFTMTLHFGIERVVARLSLQAFVVPFLLLPLSTVAPATAALLSDGRAVEEEEKDEAPVAHVRIEMWLNEEEERENPVDWSENAEEDNKEEKGQLSVHHAAHNRLRMRWLRAALPLKSTSSSTAGAVLLSQSSRTPLKPKSKKAKPQCERVAHFHGAVHHKQWIDLPLCCSSQGPAGPECAAAVWAAHVTRTTLF